MKQQLNITRIKAVYNALEELALKVVFIGGAAVSLYADRKTFEQRPTDDVDIIVEITSLSDFSALETKLRVKGFMNDVESSIICRYIIHGITVDIIPSENVLGFHNKWYTDGVANKVLYTIDENITICILNTAYFIAVKLEAFKNRGNFDGRTSSDFEDIIFLLNNRSSIIMR